MCFVLLILSSLLLLNCDQNSEKQDYNEFIREYDILTIDLLGELSDRSSEISGLCWFNDKLMILPQYPGRMSDSLSKIYFIEKSVLKKYIEDSPKVAISPSSYSIDLSKLHNYFKSGSGFESISIIDTTVFFTIEYISRGITETLLLKGEIDSSAKEIHIDEKSIVSEPTDLRIFNMSCESILTYNNRIYSIFEANGKNVNSSPKVSVFDNNLKFLGKIDFPTIEYRITDATSVDESGRFWVMNYFYPGDNYNLNPAFDNLTKIHGIGKSNSRYRHIERILELQFTDNAIILTENRPIYLKLIDNEVRNWEGIAKYDTLGFIIATDRYPGTILGFLPFPNHP